MITEDDIRTVGAEKAAELLGYSRNHFMERIACRADFPPRCNPPKMNPRWKVKDIHAWLEGNKQRRAG